MNVRDFLPHALIEASEEGILKPSSETWGILLSGPFKPELWLQKHISPFAPLVVADGGIGHLTYFSSRPLLWVGDFDSTSPEMRDKFSNIPVLELPRHKDQTDGEVAISEALKRGARRLVLIGGCGGKIDHSLSLLTMACGLLLLGVEVMVTNGSEAVFPFVPGVFSYPVFPKLVFSLVPFSPLIGVTLEGGHWILKEQNLPMGSTRPLSNVVAETPLRLSVQEGYGVLVVSQAE